MSRPSLDVYFAAMAMLVSQRGTCRRRRAGCVLVNDRGHVLATGYNGPPSGAVHCIDVPCPAAGSASGTDLERCEALHAEQNALLQCTDPWSIETAYCTTRPCRTCAKMLSNTSCSRVVYLEGYPHEPWYSAKQSLTMLDRQHVFTALADTANRLLEDEKGGSDEPETD